MKQRTSEELRVLRDKHIPSAVFHVTPIVIKRAKGAMMWDVEGKAYIDFAGGIGVQNVGHCAERVVAAIKDQAEKLIHTCFHVALYEPYIDLARRLNEICPGDFPKKTVCINSGSEAVDTVVKIARKASGRPGMITLRHAFHGRTYMAMSLTSKINPYKWGFGPFCPEVYQIPNAYCYRCPFGLTYPGCNVYCADYLEEAFLTSVPADQVAGFIAEPVQGEGGFIVPPPEYFKKIKAICERHEIFFIMDEIQSGIGRTGKLFASEHFDVVPDFIVMGKSLAGGFPLAAVTGRAEAMEKIHMGGLGGTYGGNPIGCRAALAALDVLFGEDLIQKAQRLGEKVRARLEGFQKQYEVIGDVRGLGPMMGMELVKDRKSKKPAPEAAKELTRRCYEKGLILLSCGTYNNVIRTLMPLVITDEQMEKGFRIMEESLKGL